MVLITFRVGQVPSLLDPVPGRQEVSLPDQRDASGAVLSADLFRVGAMPEVLQLLGASRMCSVSMKYRW